MQQRWMMLAIVLLDIVPFLPLHAAGEVKWEQIWDQPNVAVMYVDRSSVTGTGGTRAITTRTVYSGELPEGDIAERVRIEEFDCTQLRSRMLRTTIIANDRKPQTIDVTTPDWATFEAGSLGARKRAVACARR